MRLFKRTIKSLSLTLTLGLVLLLSSCSFIIEHLPFNIFLKAPEIMESYVTEDEDNQYNLNLLLNNIAYDEINAIYIEDIKYEDFNKISDNEYLLINFLLDVTFQDEDFLIYTISAIEINNKTVTFNKEFIIHKTIDNNIINLKKQSVVGIYSKNSRTWGSGVVIKESEIVKNNKTQYEYYIITNYHVVKDAKGFNPFKIIYDNLNKEINSGIELMAYKNDTADLALLKVITPTKTLTPLNDEQLESYLPVNYSLYDPVFAIGSPSDGKSYDFNQVKGGYILKLNISVTLKDDKKVCTKGCDAIQTTAIQGKGSSGGGVFDRYGNLIGLHFAGNSDDNISSEIPIKAVLTFLQEYFNTELLVTKKEGFSSFILLDSLLQLSHL